MDNKFKTLSIYLYPLILEMIEILNNKNSINKRSDMDCFSNLKILEKNHRFDTMDTVYI